MAIHLSELSTRLGEEWAGDADPLIASIAPLDEAGPGALSFLANPRYRAQLATTRASALILGPADRDATTLPRIVARNPYAAYARAAQVLYPASPCRPGVHPSAWVDPAASVHALACVEAGASIAAGVVVGARARIASGCALAEGSEIGEDCVLHPGVVVYPGCRIGARSILHAGTVIGADGFGFAPDQGHWVKIPQVGGVRIGVDVEIGANTTVDRGALADTVIGDGVKIDNQVQVGHNVRIGAHTVIAGCVGIAGSARIGERCRIGGAAGILGHLEIADDVEVSPFSLVTRSIRVAGKYTGGVPAQDHAAWLQNAARFRHLARLESRLEALERRLGAAAGSGSSDSRGDTP
ncbi:MAG: UDP-3-O-(3-hydroxymyristoyl)glucosamine N-acyltransferase [Pseudomonadota bacterium]